MVKFILIKSRDEWATTKQACRDELVVYLSFSSIYTTLLLLCIEHCFTKIKFHTSRIADRRSQKVLRSSAIIWKPTSAIVCDRLRSCDRDRRRSPAIVCDPAIRMETKVLRSAIETYPIIILILTQMIQNFLATKPDCSFMFVTVLSETRSSLSSV